MQYIMLMFLLFRFFWKKDGVHYERDSWRIFQPDTGGTLTFTQALKQDAGRYQCFVKNNIGTAASHVTEVMYGRK